MTDMLIPPATAADTVIRHPLTAVVPNRYQRRQINPNAVDIADLAQNIKAHGLQNPVIGRWHPGQAGVIELVSGHRRTAAFGQLAQLDPAYSTIPVIVRVLTDRQLFEACAIENSMRRDLSAIEKAISLRDYLAEFHVGQAEAGALFDLGQAAVSHLLRLLKLPAEVQAMVDHREMAERTARALVPLTEWDAAAVVKIAQGALKDWRAALKDDPESTAQLDDFVGERIDEALRKAPRLSEYETAWPLDWPAKPLPIADYQKTPGTPATARACTGCPFNLQRDDAHHCLRPACHAAKAKLWPEAAVAAASAKLGIPAAGPDEKVTVILGGSSSNQGRSDQMQKAVRAKRPELRLVPAARPDRYDYSLKAVTGSAHVWLAATNKAAIDEWLEGAKGKTVKAPVPANETPAQKERRLNGERELAEERAAERGRYNRAKADGLYLFDKAAQLVADHTVAAGGLLAWAALHPNVLRSMVEELNDARRTLESAAKLGRGDSGKPAPATPELDHTRRKYIALTELIKEVAAYSAPTQLFSKFPEMIRNLAKHAEAAFAVTLPAGWDAVPVHKTAYNCWECGDFAGNPKGFTKAELAEGWGGDAKAGYHCPLHDPKKRLVNVFDSEKAAPALEPRKKTLMVPVPGPSGKTVMVRDDSPEAAAHVRSHTRPAPKPSAAGKQPAGKPLGVSTGKPTRRATQRAQAAAPAKKGGRK